MVHIAIVDDEAQAAEKLSGLLRQYGEAHGVQFEIDAFKNAIVFLTNCQPVYDIVFFDIQMPHMDGMEAAEELRKLDSETMLIFVTNMAQFAVWGYQVRAFDFLVKPLNEDAFELKIKRMLDQLATRKEQKITISSSGMQLCLAAREIYYVEISNHLLLYHTARGDYPVYGTLSGVQKQLEGMGFSLCNNCYLVNLYYVQKVFKHTVTVRGTELPISHPRRKAFLDALNTYIGG